jgi:hypothetical protein
MNLIDEDAFHSTITALGITEPDLTPLKKMTCFIRENPAALVWRRKIKLDLATIEGTNALAEKYISARNTKIKAAIPSTVPDDAVGKIMQNFFGYDEASTNRIKLEHQHSMVAENMVGALLEKYIASRIEPDGWVWCAGELVRSVDFIKQEENGQWSLLQIKNRDNSENSSSAAIRKGTDIKKWFRTFSRTGKTNWGNFPITNLTSPLTEDGFMVYLKEYAESD